MLALFSHEMRPIQEVQAALRSRPTHDEAMAALLWEGKNRGASGYELARKFFGLLATTCPDVRPFGSTESSSDIFVAAHLPDYTNPRRKVDFVLVDSDRTTVLALGFLHYDSDRGGGQEDDRTGNYENFVYELKRYQAATGARVNALFVNDGPGLLAGSMWDDYARLETTGGEQIRVMTLRMIPERLTCDWLRGRRAAEA